MIKNVFKLNGKSIDMASSWDDFTYEQYWRIFNLKDDTAELVSIFTGIPVEDLRSATIIGLEKVIELANSITKSGPPNWDGSIDQVGPYKLPKNKDGSFNIQFESLGQFEDMRAVMKTVTDIKTLTAAHPQFVAIYLQKIRDGSYDPEKAKAMIPEIKALPAKEVITAGSFFYARLINLLHGTPTGSPSPSPSPKKMRPGSPRSSKNSGRTRR